jgi:hypothetical protein
LEVSRKVAPPPLNTAVWLGLVKLKEYAFDDEMLYVPGSETSTVLVWCWAASAAMACSAASFSASVLLGSNPFRLALMTTLEEEAGLLVIDFEEDEEVA